MFFSFPPFVALFEEREGGKRENEHFLSLASICYICLILLD